MYSFDKDRHLHSLNGTPLIGTTTALGIISKPLTWWASGLACAELGWVKSLDNDRKATDEEKLKREAERKQKVQESHAKIVNMVPNEFLALLDKAYCAHSVRLKDSAEEGMDLHGQLEEFIKSKIENRPMLFSPDKLIEPFVNWAEKNVKEFLFSELHCYSELLWTGGIADFGYIDIEGFNVLGDFKSSADAYWNHAVQIGGYDIQIEQNGGFTPDGRKMFELKKPFDYHAIFAARAGLDKPFYNKKQVSSAKKAFAYAVALYKENLFFDGFER